MQSIVSVLRAGDYAPDRIASYDAAERAALATLCNRAIEACAQAIFHKEAYPTCVESGQFNYLLSRDLNPANDNTPAFLNMAA